MRPRYALVLALAFAACGGSDKPPAPAAPKGGEVTYCVDRVDARGERAAVKRFNRENEAREYSARLRVLGGQDDVLPETCDVAIVHAVSLGDLAAEERLADLTDRVETRADEFFPAALGLARYDGRYWGIPKYVDAGLLYYDSGAGTPPFTWQEAYAKDGLVYPGMNGPSLALHFTELSLAAGGRILSEDGTTAVIDSPQNLRALELMRRGITRGNVPADVVRMDDVEARMAFDGAAHLMWNWTYLHRRLPGDADVMEPPAWGDREPASLVTGSSVVIAAESADEPVAHALADFVTGEAEAERAVADLKAPVANLRPYELTSTLDHMPFYMELERALEHAEAQPVVPDWVFMADALAERVHAALAGRMTPRAALRAAQREVEEILAGGTIPSSDA